MKEASQAQVPTGKDAGGYSPQKLRRLPENFKNKCKKGTI